MIARSVAALIVAAGCESGGSLGSSRLSLNEDEEDSSFSATAECIDGVVTGEVTSTGIGPQVTITLEDDVENVLATIEPEDFDRGGRTKTATYVIDAPAGRDSFRLCFVQGNPDTPYPKKTCVGVVCRESGGGEDLSDGGPPPGDDDGGATPPPPDAGGQPDAGAPPPPPPPPPPPDDDDDDDWPWWFDPDRRDPPTGSLSCVPSHCGRRGGCRMIGRCPRGARCECLACGTDGAPACCLEIRTERRRSMCGCGH